MVRSSDGLVLLARRLAEPGRPLAIPGGKLDAAETVEACAVRELAEETGLIIEAGDVCTYGCVLMPATPSSWIIAGVEARHDQPADQIQPHELEPGKVGEFTWIDPRDRPADMFPATAALLDRLPQR